MPPTKDFVELGLDVETSAVCIPSWYKNINVVGARMMRRKCAVLVADN